MRNCCCRLERSFNTGFVVPFRARSEFEDGAAVVFGPSASWPSINNRAPGFKSFTMRHTVQRNTFKCLGHLTRELQVMHLPVTRSFSTSSTEVPLAAIQSLVASPVGMNGDSANVSRASSLQCGSSRFSSFFPLPKIEGKG